MLNTREIQDWLLTQIAELLELDLQEIDIDESFTNYGLSSSDVVSLSGELEELLGRRLPPTLAYEYPSIKTLAAYLGESKDSTQASETEKPILQNNEPIAIIGMACRFPGASNPAAFWELLKEGRDEISEVPADRWPKEAFFHPDPAVPGKAISFWGGFLDHIDQFDPFFFGISPIEAKHMDPQQRLLMELSYEALDDAGQKTETLQGSKTGVFVGISVNEYSQLQLDDPLKITSHSGTGSALSIAANRISYFYNLRGPSVAIDTACSSSLAAIHLACQSLRNGESHLALAGGVNMILSPAHSIAFTKAGVLAPDGRCKTFDAQANGYVRGEGGGLIVLKPLSAALADEDPIHALIQGSAMTQDGRTNGLMAPSSDSQTAMLQAAYRAAGVSPEQVQYVEAHGTGTLLGDSMEATALGNVIGSARKDNPLAIGSVKTNFGHLEAAAGIAGLIKVILSIKEKTLPPSLHFEKPNPHIPFEELNLRVNHSLSPWPAENKNRLAGVSSFGFGGTNVHMIIGEASPVVAQAGADASIRHLLLPLSASSKENLKSLAWDFRKLLAEPGLSSLDICLAAGLRRSQFDHKLAVTGNSRNELIEGLEAYIADEGAANLLSHENSTDTAPKLVWVFSGQGGQWIGMGKELLELETIFHQKIQEIDGLIQQKYQWSLLEVLLEDASTSQLQDIGIIQPAIFAVQVALAALFESWGIQPDAVTGHSMGEVAAAHVAGILSLEDAIQVICLRSQLLRKLKGKGSMLATDLSHAEALETLKGHEKDISIAANNGPTSTVLSGKPEQLQTVMKVLEKEDRFCRWVKVDVASHSPQMDEVQEEMLALLQGIQSRRASIPLYSTVTGKEAGNLIFQADYWFDNLRKPVLFSDTIHQLLEDQYNSFIEIGPHPILLSAIQQRTMAAQQASLLLASMKREESQQAILFSSLAQLYVEGCRVDWQHLLPGSARHIALPPIRWQGQRYWMDQGPSGQRNPWHQGVNNDKRLHPLLGEQMELAHAPQTTIWQSTFNLEQLRYLNDHQVEEEIVIPAAAYIEMALEATHEAGFSQSFALTDFSFQQKLIVQKGKQTSIQSSLIPKASDELEFNIYSREGNHQSWNLHASCRLLLTEPLQWEEGAIQQFIAMPEGINWAPANQIYTTFQKKGIDYGPDFQGIERIASNENIAWGQIILSDSLQYDQSSYQLHPALLDACLQVIGSIPGISSAESLYLPVGCEAIHFAQKPSGQVWCHVSMPQVPEADAEQISADVLITDKNQQLIIALKGFRLQRIQKRRSRKVSLPNTWLYQLKWQVQSSPETIVATDSQNWLIFADEGGLGHKLAEKLEAKGDNCEILAYNSIREKQLSITNLISQALDASTQPLHGIIYLWNLSASSHTPQEADFQPTDCLHVMHLVQVLAKRLAASPRLWLVTQGAQAVQPGEEVAVSQSAIWGLGKTISFELPELKCVRLDLEHGIPATKHIDSLFAELYQDQWEDQIAFREGNRFVQRLLPFTQLSPTCKTPTLLYSQASYLITGGLGGLGLATAKWMVEQGARHLVLLGRSAPSPYVVQELEQMRQAGVQVNIQAADVSDAGQMKAVFEKIDGSMPPLKGIIHAAGLLDDGSILNMTEERMEKVMAPKVAGSWNLHRESLSLSLDFFVLYSSAVSVLGSPGQGNYAAASAYLDAVAYHRQYFGLPAVSINWGPWAEVGLAAEAAARLAEQNASTEHLVKVIKIQEGLEILEMLLTEATPQVAALPFDLKNLLELYPTAAKMPFFAEVGGSDSHVARLYARPKLKQAYVAPSNEIEQKLAELWQQTLHIDRVGIHDSFFELGGDSVLAAQVLAQARKAYGISINPQDAFQAFTIERLAELLEAEIIRQIEEMSEEEAERLLSEDN